MATIVDRDFDDSALGVLVTSQWGERSLSQFFDVPERRLLLAVLVDAVRVMLGDDLEERAGVVRWMRGGAARIPFADLCHNLEVDPVVTARRLRGPLDACREALRSQAVTTRRVPSVRRSAPRDQSAPVAASDDRLSA